MAHSYFDFFAGGGMAGVGLGPDWSCTFANDIDAKKANSYRANHHGGDELLLRDVAQVTPEDLPGQPDLIWASFPCQDLSLAGKGAGLAGKRSGMFKPFWKLVRQMQAEGRAPKIIALENVCGAITSNGGRDFATLAAAFSGIGYRFGAVVVDAVHFLPQSRPRFFMIGVHPDVALPDGITAIGPSALWHTPALIEGHRLLSKAAQSRWLWWDMAAPPARNSSLSALIEDAPKGVDWHSPEDTRRLLDMMSDVNRAKVQAAQEQGCRVVGTVYKRTRTDGDGVKRQRAEVRFDEIAGCLRTPAGGSSRQTILVVEGAQIRSRLLAPREAARLMGLPEDYTLPERYNDAYKLAGDGVAVPVVRHLAQQIFEPLLKRAHLTLVA
jgi:DNA (cytosine-5)-methyltransferase 1